MRFKDAWHKKCPKLFSHAPKGDEPIVDREIEVMSVLRLLPLGKLVVQAGNRRYEKLDELPQGALRQRVLAAIGELVAFAGGYETLVEAGLAPALIAAENKQALQHRQEAFLNALAQRPDQKAPPPTTLARRLSPASHIPPPDAAPPPTDIAAQINAILHRHLEAEPELAGRRVRLVGGASATLKIEVDGHFYDSPSEIPDVAVQALIKKALRDWDRK